MPDPGSRGDRYATTADRPNGFLPAAASARTVGTASNLYSVGETRHYFACRLRHLLSLTALGGQDQGFVDRYPVDLRRRQVELLNCLINPGDERFTYEIRILSSPDVSLYTRGRITVAILCRVDGLGPEEAGGCAGEFLRLLEASFDEYEFEAATAEEIMLLLSPFPIGHLAYITRRCAREALDTLRGGDRRQRRIGFPADAEPHSGAGPRSDGRVLHIFPYLPPSSPFNGLFKLMLLEPAPVAVSYRLRPTALTPDEERFLERQIAICERSAQVGLGPVTALEDLSALQPTLQEQARAYQRYQSRMLHGLRDNAALVTVEIASTAPISHVIADAVGGLVTSPAGGTTLDLEESPFRYLAGGYEVVIPESGDQAAQAFERLDLVIAPHPLAPPGAERLLYLFDSVEAATAFRLPSATVEAPLGIEVKHWRAQPAPRDLPDRGLLVGASVQRGVAQPVRIGRDDRLRHIYTVGQTGTGKTTLLKTMIVDDIQAGEGLCVIDPHGDLYRELLGKIPEQRIEDVVLLDPTDTEYPIGLNMLEYETEAQRYFLVQELVGIISRLMEDEFGYGAIKDFAGPQFFQHMRMNLLLTMSNPADPGTLLEFYNIYQEKGYWKRWLPLQTDDPQLKRWVANVLPETDYLKQGSEGSSMGGYVGSKFEGFIFDPMLRNIFGQKRSTINLREIMDSGKILLVNLAKGELTETNSRFLGMVLLAKLQAAAMGRVRILPHERRDFHVYVDEFQSIATQSFITMLSEARKFGLSLILANQFISQIKDPRIIQSVFGNVGTLICFRLGQADAELMEREMFPVFTRSDLISLPNWHAYMTTLVNGQTVRPFNLETVLAPVAYDEDRTRRVRAASTERYGRSRHLVEREIAQSLAVLNRQRVEQREGWASHGEESTFFNGSDRVERSPPRPVP
jgi:hypothetical protein